MATNPSPGPVGGGLHSSITFFRHDLAPVTVSVSPLVRFLCDTTQTLEWVPGLSTGMDHTLKKSNWPIKNRSSNVEWFQSVHFDAITTNEVIASPQGVAWLGSGG